MDLNTWGYFTRINSLPPSQISTCNHFLFHYPVSNPSLLLLKEQRKSWFFNGKHWVRSDMWLFPWEWYTVHFKISATIVSADHRRPNPLWKSLESTGTKLQLRSLTIITPEQREKQPQHQRDNHLGSTTCKTKASMYLYNLHKQFRPAGVWKSTQSGQIRKKPLKRFYAIF